jgi:uncharacterized membrane protein YcfT
MMSKHLLLAAMLLAYGPFVIMALLYLVGLALRLAGRPALLRWLVARTQIPAPVRRGDGVDGIVH